MKEQIRAKFEAYWDEMMADLAALVAVNSVRGRKRRNFLLAKNPPGHYRLPFDKANEWDLRWKMSIIMRDD